MSEPLLGDQPSPQLDLLPLPGVGANHIGGRAWGVGKDVGQLLAPARLIQQRAVVCTLAGIHVDPPVQFLRKVLCPDVVGEVHDVTDSETQAAAAQAEAVGPLATPAPVGVEQGAGVVNPGKASDGLTLPALVQLHALCPQFLCLTSSGPGHSRSRGLPSTSLTGCTVDPLEEAPTVPLQQHLHQHVPWPKVLTLRRSYHCGIARGHRLCSLGLQLLHRDDLPGVGLKGGVLKRPGGAHPREEPAQHFPLTRLPDLHTWGKGAQRGHGGSGLGTICLEVLRGPLGVPVAHQKGLQRHRFWIPQGCQDNNGLLLLRG
eukprot:RCo046025